MFKKPRFSKRLGRSPDITLLRTTLFWHLILLVCLSVCVHPCFFLHENEELLQLLQLLLLAAVVTDAALMHCLLAATEDQGISMERAKKEYATKYKKGKHATWPHTQKTKRLSSFSSTPGKILSFLSLQYVYNWLITQAVANWVTSKKV